MNEETSFDIEVFDEFFNHFKIIKSNCSVVGSSPLSEVYVDNSYDSPIIYKFLKSNSYSDVKVEDEVLRRLIGQFFFFFK
jgi:hypothetical protein